MARLARIVIPGLPHHVTQRGNRREAIFFEDGDHEIYLIFWPSKRGRPTSLCGPPNKTIKASNRDHTPNRPCL